MQLYKSPCAALLAPEVTPSCAVAEGLNCPAVAPGPAVSEEPPTVGAHKYFFIVASGPLPVLHALASAVQPYGVTVTWAYAGNE